MAQPPAYIPPEQQNTTNPPQGAYPQPVAYPQGQSGVVYPNQPGIVTQGNPTHVNQIGIAQIDCCRSGISEHYKARVGYGTGVVHLAVSGLSIILGGMAFAFGVGRGGYGIWSAIIFFIPTGILGITSKNKNSRLVVAYMVMSILTSLQALGMMSFEARVAASLTNCSDYYSDCDESIGKAVVIHSILALLGAVESTNAILSAAYCCNGHACCCAPASSHQGAVSTTTVQYGQPQAQPMTVVAGK